jgi:hypothetical protein
VADFVLRTGDLIAVTIAAPALVPQLQAPVPLTGSSRDVQINNMAVCLLGDELPRALATPLAYTAPPFVTPGTGKLTVTLLPGNVTRQTINGKPLLLKGGRFPVVFTVQTPATQPTPTGPVPDAVLVKQGTAQFITTNSTVLAG